MPSAICFNLDQSKILSSGNGLTTLGKKPFESIVGKRENAGNQVTSIFFLFSKCFPHKRHNAPLEPC